MSAVPHRSHDRHKLAVLLFASFALLVAVFGSAANADEPVATTTSTSAPGERSVADESTTTSESSTTTTTDQTTEPTTEVTAPDGVVTTTGGDLVWGVRSTFVNYIRGPIAKGSITVDGGAVDNTGTDGTFTFPGIAGGTFDGSTNDTDASFAGSVHFTGHDYGNGPELDLLLEDFRIVRDTTGSWLLADVTSVPFEGTSGGGAGPDEPEIYDDLKVVDLATDGVLPVSTPPDGLTWYDLAADLTEEAVPAFGLYAAGDDMDPVTYTLTFDEVPDVPVDPVGPVTPVVTLDKSTVQAGDLLTASAPGFTPGEQVEVWLHSDPVWVTTAVADADGAVTTTFTVPLDTPAGIHQVELRGISSGESVFSADFTVTAAPLPASTSTGVLPQTGADGRIALVGLVLLAAGLTLVVIERRAGRRSGVPVG